MKPILKRKKKIKILKKSRKYKNNTIRKKIKEKQPK